MWNRPHIHIMSSHVISNIFKRRSKWRPCTWGKKEEMGKEKEGVDSRNKMGKENEIGTGKKKGNQKKW